MDANAIIVNIKIVGMECFQTLALFYILYRLILQLYNWKVKQWCEIHFGITIIYLYHYIVSFSLVPEVMSNLTVKS